LASLLHARCQEDGRFAKTATAAVVWNNMRMLTSKRSAVAGPVRVGLLGAGGIAEAHAAALKSLSPDVELVAITDVDPLKAGRLAERWNVRSTFSSIESMQASAQPDVVHVLLPPEMHAAFAVRSMAGGAHVFVEKPLCISDSECREIETAAAHFDRLVGVNHNVTFEPAFLRLIETIGARRLGAIQHVSVFWSVPFGLNTFDAPLYRREGPGAVILETGPHPLSLVVRLLGEVKAAAVLASAETSERLDTWQASLQCERGTAQAFIAIGRPFLDARVHVVGEDGSATADLPLDIVSVVENTRYTALFSKFADALQQARAIAGTATRRFVDRVSRIPAGGATDDGAAIIRASITQFYQALRAGAEPRVSLTEGLAVVRSCLRIIEATKARTVERVEEEPWAATASS
jgi:predicted dehydrogenase